MSKKSRKKNTSRSVQKNIKPSVTEVATIIDVPSNTNVIPRQTGNLVLRFFKTFTRGKHQIPHTLEGHIPVLDDNADVKIQPNKLKLLMLANAKAFKQKFMCITGDLRALVGRPMYYIKKTFKRSPKENTKIIQSAFTANTPWVEKIMARIDAKKRKTQQEKQSRWLKFRQLFINLPEYVTSLPSTLGTVKFSKPAGNPGAVLSSQLQAVKVTPPSPSYIKRGWLKAGGVTSVIQTYRSIHANFTTKAKTLHDTHINKLETALKIGIMLIPVLFTSFIGYKVYSAYNYQGSYSVPFTFDNFQNKNLPLYINEDPKSYKFGQTKDINGQQIPEIQSSPISFVWKPKEFPLGKNITVSAEIQDQGDWDISVVCPNCEAKDKYNWKPFYRGKLNDYNLVKSYDGTNVYVRKDLSPSNVIPPLSVRGGAEGGGVTSTPETPNNYTDANSLDEWMSKNVKPGTSVEILDKSYPTSKFVNPDIDFIEGSSTTIDKTLRGPHIFYVYLKDKMDLEIVKEDLNQNNLDDRVDIRLEDLDGVTYFQDAILDDNLYGKYGQSFSKSFTNNGLKAGVYKLSLSGTNDWLIKKLKINTNKIVLAGKTLVVDEANLYSNILSETKSKLYYWDRSASQTINFKSSIGDNIVNLTPEKLGAEQYINLSSGNYNFTTKGNVMVTLPFVSFTKEQFFNVSVVTFDSSNHTPDFVVSNLAFESGNNSIAKKVFTISDFSNIDNLNQIEFTVRNNDLESDYRRNELYNNEGYYAYYTNGVYSTWTKRNEKFTDINIGNNISLVDYINQVIPPFHKIFISAEQRLQSTDLVITDAPDGFNPTSALVNTINTHLRGSHSFYLYLNNELNAQISKTDTNSYEGADSILLSLTDINGNRVCSDSISDDGNTSKNNFAGSTTKVFACTVNKPGVYVFNLIEDSQGQEKSDFILTQIRLNTNKVMIKDKVLSSQPLTLYTNNITNDEIGFYYWLPDKSQIITIRGVDKTSTVNLGKNEIDKTINFTLTSGEHEIIIPMGSVRVRGQAFALQKDSFFKIFKYIPSAQNDNPDFRVIQRNNEGDSQLINLSVDVSK